ncbi:hypothetical protein E5S67_01704 [Microcoleus sp. IPMA8]|uniref:Transposase n=1 Tax=Microcoleus asticus IPMA8 TaxID=2563858 RepID=A0ABX2CUP5_9CYAN|nr:hypothetical protein [Microcoleus asticus IPMA8]
MVLALDSNTREIVGVYIGARDEAAARQLWNSLPPVYRQCAVAHTDFWAAMEQCYRKSVINLWVKKRVRPVILNDSTTPYKERVSRLVRKTLSFSCVIRQPYRCNLVFHPSL